jgi:hypothetical protein
VTPECTFDQARSDTLRPCMATDYSLEQVRDFVPFDPFADPDGFPLCCLSKRTVVYSCGAIARKGDEIQHDHPPGELELCRCLSSEAAKVVDGLEVGMGSEGTPATIDADPNIGTDNFVPFFVTANGRDQVANKLSEEVIRRRFGGVIYPECAVIIEPLREAGDWWASVLLWYEGGDAEDESKKLLLWRNMIRWFNAQKDFCDTAFVSIGDQPEDGGACRPRLAVGLTRAGSLAGILGIVVHS